MEVLGAGTSTSADTSGPHTQPAKRKFFQWAVKWFYANMSEDFEEKPDAPNLACLLQSIGFQLREFEKVEDTCSNVEGNKQEVKNEGIRVTIECGTSGMRACLEMEDVKCQCPNSEDAKDASFWSVSGTGPAATVESTNKVEESGSNLLPPMSKETRRLFHDVVYRLLSMIGDKTCDVNHNRSHSNLNLSRVSSTRDMMEIVNDEAIAKNDSLKNIVRSHTQPEIAVSGTNGAHRRYNWPARPLVKETMTGIPGFIRKPWGETMDLECGSIDGDQPRPSPPKIASSPVVLNQLCSSLGQISLQSEEEAGNLAEHVVRAHRSLEKAVEILLGKRSPISRYSPINDDGTFLKPPEGGLAGGAVRKKSSSSSSLRVSPTNLPSSRPGSSCSMPGRVLSTSATATTASRGSLGVKSPMTRRSVGSALAKLSSTPLSSVGGAKRIGALAAGGGTSGAGGATGGAGSASKIPGRRKSFGALVGQPLKLAVPKPRNAAIGTKNKNNATSPTSIPPEERIIVTAKRRVSPDPKSIGNNSGIQKPAASGNPGNPTTVPTLKVAPMKTCTQPKDASARKSLANPKFGFSNKKA